MILTPPPFDNPNLIFWKTPKDTRRKIIEILLFKTNIWRRGASFGDKCDPICYNKNTSFELGVSLFGGAWTVRSGRWQGVWGKTSRPVGTEANPMHKLQNLMQTDEQASNTNATTFKTYANYSRNNTKQCKNSKHQCTLTKAQPKQCQQQLKSATSTKPYGSWPVNVY